MARESQILPHAPGRAVNVARSRVVPRPSPSNRGDVAPIRRDALTALAAEPQATGAPWITARSPKQVPRSASLPTDRFGSSLGSGPNEPKSTVFATKRSSQVLAELPRRYCPLRRALGLLICESALSYAGTRERARRSSWGIRPRTTTSSRPPEKHCSALAEPDGPPFRLAEHRPPAVHPVGRPRGRAAMFCRTGQREPGGRDGPPGGSLTSPRAS